MATTDEGTTTMATTAPTYVQLFDSWAGPWVRVTTDPRSPIGVGADAVPVATLVHDATETAISVAAELLASAGAPMNEHDWRHVTSQVETARAAYVLRNR